MAENEEIDVAIVGAGVAGITAALYAKRKALSVRLFESKALGGQAAEAVWVENYPGVTKAKGAQLMQRMSEQLKEFGVEAEEAAEVTGIEKKGNLFELDINKGEEKLQAKSVVLCTGGKYRLLNVPGEKELYGKGVSYCATCDGPAFKDKTVAVVGAGNSGANAALFFAEICKKVYLIEFSEKPGFDSVYEKPLKETKVELMTNTQVVGIEGEKHVTGIKYKDKSQEEKRLAVDGVFIYIGMQPNNELAKKLGLKLNEKGYVSVNQSNKTSMEGVFAAGDITGQLAQIVVAAGSGAIAATTAFEFLKGLK